ncbi:hypothetical protein [Solibacillus sp. FSL H8-0538]|uniref:hypothetical protein n=1 Tax=Solibacillus sp. FSL H8-0538 TaxID=2921400 RepID=UPI0030F8D48C
MKIVLLYVLCTVSFLLALSMNTTGAFVFFLIISLGMLLWARIETKIQTDRRNAEIRRRAEELVEEVSYTEYILSSDFLNALIMDEVTTTLYIANREDVDSRFERKKYPFTKILEAAIVEDGRILSLFPKDGLLGGERERGPEIYVVNSNDEANKESEDETVSKLSLKMVVNDLSNPTVEYVFMENEESLTKDSDEYKEVFKLCNDWHQKISVIIKRYEYTRVPIRQWH